MKPAEFKRQYYPAIKRVCAETGLNPLFVAAQAALESGWGDKAIGNNIFGITAGEYSSQGSYTVDGDAYYIEVDGAEVYCDGKTRYEVDNGRREVNVDSVEGASRNILDNPTRCFDFVGTDYDAGVSSRTASETTLHLRSRDASVEGDIYLTVETVTGRPRHITYVLYDDRIEVAVESLEPSREAVRRYDAKRYSDYETIDFR